MADSRNFGALVWERADSTGKQDIYHFHWANDKLARPLVMSYRQLDGVARRLATWLSRHGRRQPAQVLVLQSKGWHFAESLFGCWYAGAVAVPVAATGGRHYTERLQSILRTARIDAVLTDTACAPEVSRQLAWAGYGEIDCLAVDVLPEEAPDAWQPPDHPADRTALIQYTSGSTGEPKGVTVSHANLFANHTSISRAFGTGPDSVVGGWLPLHHDMGLIGQLLHPVWLGGTGVLMPPWEFLREPVQWLRMIDKSGITHSAAPSYGYDLCLERVTEEQCAGLDLSRWQRAVIGAEPVLPATLDAFADRFGPAGFRAAALAPAYGLAEATLLVSGEHAGRPEGPPRTRLQGREVISCGLPAGAEVRIVEPDLLSTLSDGQVGEVWVRGGSVGRGYWQRPTETRRSFDATTREQESGFLRTGDLGLLADGELYLTGRLKDLIIIDGHNLYPHDVEHSIHLVSPFFGAGAAFSVQSEREHVVVVQEVRSGRGRSQDLGELAEAVRQRLAADFEVSSASVLLVRPGTIRRTTSGKIQRSLVKQLFLNGALDPLYQSVTASIVEAPAAGGARSA